MGDVNTPSGECVFFRDKCSLYPDKCDLCKVKQINSILVMFERLQSLKERQKYNSEMLKNFVKNSSSYFFNTDEVLSAIINVDEFIETMSPIVNEIYIKISKEFIGVMTKRVGDIREINSFKEIDTNNRRDICEKVTYISKVLYRMNCIYEYVERMKQNPNNTWWKKLINIEVCLILTKLHHGIIDD